MTDQPPAFSEAMVTALALVLGPYVRRSRPVVPQSDEERERFLSAAQAKRDRRAAKRLRGRGAVGVPEDTP